MLPVADGAGAVVEDAATDEDAPGDVAAEDVGPGVVGGATAHAPTARTASAVSVRHLDAVGRIILAIVAGRRAACRP